MENLNFDTNPNLRFSGFSRCWEKTSIGKVLTIGSGKDYKHLSDGDIPVYGTGGYMLSVDNFLYDGESVCIGRKGTIDKPVLLSGKFWTVDTLFYTHSFKNCIPRFIYAYFQRIDWKNYNEASGVPSLSKSTIEKIDIKIPSVEEQTKIASFLTAIDEKIAQLTQKADLLARYKKGVMQQIFSQKLRFKDDDGQDFHDWEDKNLGEVTSKISDNRNKSLSDVKVYSVTNNNGFVLQSDHFDRVVAGNDLSNYKIIQKNEFAYNPARINVGSIAYFKDEIGIISSLYVCFKTNDNLLDEFLFGILELDYTKFQIENLGEGGVRIYLWYDLFALIKCKIPCIEEQTKIANFLTSLDDKISHNQTQLNALKQYKQGLLQQLFV